MADEKNIKSLVSRKGLSPDLVDAVRDILAGKKVEVEVDDENPKEMATQEEGKKLSSKEKMKRGLYNSKLDPVDPKQLKGKHKDRADKDIDNDGDVDSSDKYLHRRRKKVMKAINTGNNMNKTMKEEDQVDEGKFKDMVTKDQENKRLGKTTMIANPRTQKVRKVTPSRAKMAVKKGFVYAEHMEGLEEADAFKGQPVGVTVTMKHKQTGQKQKTSFPGTHSAVAGAKAHIAQMQKKGYEVHSKNLMYGKKEDVQVDELSRTTLSNYMKKSAASVSGKDAKTQDKRISGQSMADKKIRKAQGYSSDAKVAASEGTEYHVKIRGGKYAPGGVETRSVKAKSPEHAIKKVKKGHMNPGGEFTAHPVNEARRGRPPKSGVQKSDDMEAGKHIVMQLRKSVSLRGQHPVEFKSGETKKISSQHAQKALNTHARLRTPIEKKAFQDKLHKSHSSFQAALTDKQPGKAPAKRGISLGGSPRVGGRG